MAELTNPRASLKNTLRELQALRGQLKAVEREKQEPARLELAQHRFHARTESSEAAAHVVVDADIAVETVERRGHALFQLGITERKRPAREGWPHSSKSAPA